MDYILISYVSYYINYIIFRSLHYFSLKIAAFVQMHSTFRMTCWIAFYLELYHEITKNFLNIHMFMNILLQKKISARSSTAI